MKVISRTCWKLGYNLLSWTNKSGIVPSGCEKRCMFSEFTDSISEDSWFSPVKSICFSRCIPTETGSKSSFSLHSSISLRIKILDKCVQSLTCFYPKWINKSCMKPSYILMSPNFYVYRATLNINIFKVSFLIHGKKNILKN